MQFNLLHEIKSFFALLKTAEFSKGIQFGVAAIVPLFITGYFGVIEYGIPMSVGVLLSSPSDVQGSFHRRIIGVSFSVVAAVAGSLLAGYAAHSAFFFVPVLILLMFGFSMISVYGFRASLIAFSGLFAVVLSLANVSSEITVLERSLLIGAGGLWYLSFTALVHYILRKRETEVFLAEAFDLTADYLETRMKLIDANSEESEELQKQLIDLQTSLNEKHETIRELVISRRKNFGRSGVVRKKLLIFMELVDILEVGMSNPVNFGRMKVLFKDHPEELRLVQDWNTIMASQLRKIAEVWRDHKKYVPNRELVAQKERVWKAFEEFEQKAKIPEERQTLLVYRNLLVFKDKQHQRILSIERLLREWNRRIETNIKVGEAAKFITSQEYDLKTVQNNFDLKSPIFRHSVRLTVTLVIGFFIGKIFEFQNAYWILLTTLVIMRPGYALTKDRSKQRLYGTLIGGAVAVSIVLLVQNTTVYGILSIISLILAFSMIQRNYKTAAAFITLNVVFLYSLLRPDVLEVIQYRVLDTLIGAALAFLANKFLWPTWEYSTIHDHIANSIKANCHFLKEIQQLYQEKKKVETSYRLARKKAFLAIGDLNAAFQRMAQEPKSGELDLGRVFNIVSINQEMLSATASLGTFIRSHSTTSASRQFHVYMEGIQQNLKYCSTLVQKEIYHEQPDSVEIAEAEAHFEDLFTNLVNQRQKEKEDGQQQISEPLRLQLQEVQIVVDQIKWLWQLSENLKSILQKKEGEEIKSHPFEVA